MLFDEAAGAAAERGADARRGVPSGGPGSRGARGVVGRTEPSRDTPPPVGTPIAATRVFVDEQ